MYPDRPRILAIVLAVAMTASGCSTTSLKKENASLQQQVQQDEQALHDYADKLRNARTMSEQEQARLRSEMEQMRRQLNQALQENRVLAKKLEDLTVIEMEETVMFGTGTADLNQQGKAIVEKIANTFSQYSGYHMRIEGYTDNLPIGTDLKQHYFSNWELSAARAATVARYMIYGLEVPAENLSIAGYADTRPVASNDSKEGRAQNRRIRAVVFKD